MKFSKKRGNRLAEIHTAVESNDWAMPSPESPIQIPGRRLQLDRSLWHCNLVTDLLGQFPLEGTLAHPHFNMLAASVLPPT